MLGGGVHLADLMLWIVGERPDTVAAVGNRIATRGSAFRYPDFVSATYRFPSGCVGRITANFGCVHRHQHALRVFGTKASFIYDDAGPRLHRTRDPSVAPSRLTLSPLPATKGDLIPEFVGAIAAREDWTDRTRHEFDVISTCLAADLSFAANQTTRIEYV